MNNSNNFRIKNKRYKKQKINNYPKVYKFLILNSSRIEKQEANYKEINKNTIPQLAKQKMIIYQYNNKANYNFNNNSIKVIHFKYHN